MTETINIHCLKPIVNINTYLPLSLENGKLYFIVLSFQKRAIEILNIRSFKIIGYPKACS